MAHDSAGCTGSIAASASEEASGNLQSWQEAKGKQAHLTMAEQEEENGGRAYTLLNNQISQELTHYHENSIGETAPLIQSPPTRSLPQHMGITDPSHDT